MQLVGWTVVVGLVLTLALGLVAIHVVGGRRGFRRDAKGALHSAFVFVWVAITLVTITSIHLHQCEWPHERSFVAACPDEI